MFLLDSLVLNSKKKKKKNEQRMSNMRLKNRKYHDLKFTNPILKIAIIFFKFKRIIVVLTESGEMN